MGDPISLTIAAVGVAGSLFESRKARKDTQKARRIDERRNRLQAARSATEQVRQAQIARADVIALGTDQGVADSSAVRGAAGSIQSQAGGNIAFAQQLFSLQQSAGRLRESAQLRTANAQGFQSLATLAASTDFTSKPKTPAPVITATPG